MWNLFLFWYIFFCLYNENDRNEGKWATATKEELSFEIEVRAPFKTYSLSMCSACAKREKEFSKVDTKYSEPNEMDL